MKIKRKEVLDMKEKEKIVLQEILDNLDNIVYYHNKNLTQKQYNVLYNAVFELKEMLRKVK